MGEQEFFYERGTLAGQHLALSYKGFAEKPCFRLDRSRGSRGSSSPVQMACGERLMGGPQSGTRVNPEGSFRSFRSFVGPLGAIGAIGGALVVLWCFGA